MTFKKKYIVATRPSALAYTQTRQTVRLLEEKYPGITFEIVKFSTHGDRVTDQPLTQFGGTGVFVKELENAISDGRADFAIHSLKDVPSEQPSELVLAAYPQREDPRDVFLTSKRDTIQTIRQNFITGTGSPRRILQIAILRPDAVFKDLRGNIDTRISKLEKGEYDAAIFASAGLIRLGKQIPAEAFLSVEECVPAIGQGAIVIECKKNDDETIKLLQTINHRETEVAVSAERSFMKTVGGGCKFPLGAYAVIENEMIQMTVMIGDHLKKAMVRFTEKDNIQNPEKLGVHLAEKILVSCREKGIDYRVP